jgi:hypothetical protein
LPIAEHVPDVRKAHDNHDAYRDVIEQEHQIRFGKGRACRVGVKLNVRFMSCHQPEMRQNIRYSRCSFDDLTGYFARREVQK